MGTWQKAAVLLLACSRGISLQRRSLRSTLAVRGDRGTGVCAADGVAVDDQLHAAVALAAFRGVVGGDGLRFSKAPRADGRAGDALLREKIPHRIVAAVAALL